MLLQEFATRGFFSILRRESVGKLVDQHPLVCLDRLELFFVVESFDFPFDFEPYLGDQRPGGFIQMKSFSSCLGDDLFVVFI